MKHPDGTPYTPAERTAERVRRYESLGCIQASAHPISPESLPLFLQYAEGELSLEEVREALQRRYNRRRFPEGPDGPEVPEPLTIATTDEVTSCEDTIVVPPDRPRPSREEFEASWTRLIERQRQRDPDNPWVGRRVTVTASYPDEDERELN